MRVTHVITRLILGGAQENTLASVLGLRAKPGLDVRLISGPTTGPEGSLESQASAVPGLFTLVPELIRPVSPASDWLALRHLTNIFRETKPDIVHTHSGKAGILGRSAARRAGVPVIIHTIHGPSFGPWQGAFANLAFKSAERYAARATTHFVSVADAMSRQYLAAGIGRPEQFTRIVSGFDLAPFLAATNDPRLRARLGLAPGDFVVGMIARLTELKGHDDLFDLAPGLLARCPRVKLLLVGGGPWRARLEARARQLGLAGRVTFAGLIPPADVPRFTGVMDAVAHLSTREGLARALPQALAAGKPVVAYDCDGAREVCLDGGTGFLVPAGERETVASKLALLCESDELRARLGARGRELVKSEFTVERMVDELHALYLRLALPQPATGNRQPAIP